MLGRFLIDDAGLLRVLRSALPPGRDQDAACGAVERWIHRQPQELVGGTVASKILGTSPANVTRWAARGQMPESLHVEGTGPAYLKTDVEALARRRERAGVKA